MALLVLIVRQLAGWLADPWWIVWFNFLDPNRGEGWWRP